MIDYFGEMVGQLGHIPDLPGARCRGHHELFDAAVVADRNNAQGVEDRDRARAAALDLCATCPALHACRDWLATLPATERPHGVIAGQIVSPAPRPPGRPRTRDQHAEQFAKLRATGMSYRAIAEATGTSEPTVRRALTSKGPQPMTTTPQPADNRRATSLVVHYGNANLEGVNAILAEAVETTRVTPLILAVMDLHEGIIPILLTADGLACASHMVYTLTTDDDADTTRAAQLITAHSQRDVDAFTAVMRQAADAIRVTELLIALLAVCRNVIPQLYCELGLKVLERSVLTWAAREGQEGSQ